MRKTHWLALPLLVALTLLIAPLTVSSPLDGVTTFPPTSPDWVAEGEQVDAWLGRSVGAGDWNSDGYGDLIIGAPHYDNGQVDEGAAFAYYGSAAGLPATPDWFAESNNAGAGFGVAVESAGDVNGDGYEDAIVGAYHYSGGLADEGAAFLYYGSADGLSPTPAWHVEGEQYNAQMGVFVDTAGDVNHDGYADVIVGARYYNGGGRAFAYYGGPAGLPLVPDWTADGNGSFGITVATLGDVANDGFDDVIVGSYSYTNGQWHEGAAYAYYGSEDGLSPTANWQVEGNEEAANMGWMVASAGDVNGDGYKDAFVGAHFGEYGNRAGRAYVYYGSETGLETTPAWVVEGDQVGSRFTFSGGLAGDVNDDGFDDILVGALYYTNGQYHEGKAFLYLGSAGGPSTTPVWTVEGEQANAIMGDFAGKAGDVNGDGGEDWVASATWYDNGQLDEGVVYLYYGVALPPPCDPVHDLDFTWSPLQPRAGEEVTFVATATGTLPIDFQWQFGDGATGSGSTVTHTYTAAGTYNVTLVASNACGQAAVDHNITVQPETGFVFVDIKPRSCPNPVNPRDHGVLPVAVLGTAGFDVTRIDPASVRLIGVAPLRWSYHDVAAPIDVSGYCECTTAGPDGYLDLVLHFDVQEVIAALPKNQVHTASSITNPPGTTYRLLLEATLAGGGAVEGQDCIILLPTVVLH